MQRNFRQKKILEIIKEKEIETQQELCEELSGVGLDVTQDNVSLQIWVLHLYKVIDQN